jgi:transposase InsO family protein
MELHGSAVLSRRQRRRFVGLVAGGVTITAAAVAVWCSRQTASKWVGRARRNEGLEDRSSRPYRSPRRVSAMVGASSACRAARGPHLFGWATGVPASTVYAILRRHGCSRLVERPRRAEIVRYQRQRPGELVHIDCKKLGRILRPGHRVTGDRSRRAQGKAGWQHLFVAVDDATRLAYAELNPDETNASAISFLEACQRFHHEHGITIERVLTDNGTCFRQRWHDACQHHQITVKRTRPYRPQTNGNAERFIRTLLDRWAYATPYPTEHHRAHALPQAIDTYNRNRPHRALGGRTPLQRVNDPSGTNT